MKITVAGDIRGNFSVCEIIESYLPPSMVAMMKASGQVDSGKRQTLRPLQQENFQEFLATVDLNGNDGPMTFLGGGEGSSECYEIAQKLAEWETGHGRPTELQPINREVPCL